MRPPPPLGLSREHAPNAGADQDLRWGPRSALAEQKTSRWHAPSKGTASRVKQQEAREQADRRLGKVDHATLESSQAALERKAKIYEDLKRGGTGGLSERQLKEAAVDVRPLSRSSLAWPPSAGRAPSDDP